MILKIEHLFEVFGKKNWKKNVLTLTPILVAISANIALIDHFVRVSETRAESEIKISEFVQDLNAAISITEELATLHRYHAEISQQELDLFYYSILNSNDLRIVPESLQLAPNGIITYESPWTGGPNIGSNLFADPAKKEEALAAAEKNVPVLDGPLNLKHGGTALIVRHPVNANWSTLQPEIWGLSIAVFDWEDIIRYFRDIEEELNIDLRVAIKTSTSHKIVYPNIVDIDETIPNSIEVRLGRDTVSFNLSVSAMPSFEAIAIAFLVNTLATFIYVYLAAQKSRELYLLQMRNSLKFSESLVSASVGAYAVLDENLKRVFSSDSFRDLFGSDFDRTDVSFFENLRNLQSKDKKIAAEELTSLEVGKIHVAPTLDELYDTRGQLVHLRRSARWFTSPVDNQKLLWIGVDDVTELELQRRLLEKIANVDDLTRLSTRRYLFNSFNDEIRDKDHCLYIIDVDHFKSVNDNYGHASGDACLRHIGQILKQFLEKYDGAAFRLGGEEFAIVADWRGWQKSDSCANSLRQVIEETVFEGEGLMGSSKTFRRTVSIGYAFLGREGKLSEAMVLADLALSEAKKRGRNLAIGADDETTLYLKSIGAFATLDDVRSALINREISYYLQPIKNAVSGEIVGFEALLRWFLEDGTYVSPMQYFDDLQIIARESSFVTIMKQMVADVLCDLSGLPDAFVSFNFNLSHFSVTNSAAELIDIFGSVLDHPRRKIMIELNEHEDRGRANLEIQIAELEKLRSHGFLIALEDFGWASSSFQRLHELPIDLVKLDKSLVDGVFESPIKKVSIEYLSTSLGGMGYTLVAAGVETQAQMEFLLSCNINLHQGFFHAPPMTGKKAGSL